MLPFDPEFAGTIDIPLMVFLLFVLFFFGLVLYLQRESRREGYPLEDDVTGRLEPSGGFFFWPPRKTYAFANGAAPILKPDDLRDPADLPLRRVGRAPGSPYEPVGDPLTAGVGPGSWARRADRPDAMADGSPRLRPMRLVAEYTVDEARMDPRGKEILGADREVAGVVTDMWVDRMEFMSRYLEVELAGGGGRILVPMNMAVVSRSGGPVKVDALKAAQFAGAPRIAREDQITLLEEDKIMGYFGAGYLYATPARAEPLL